MINNFKIRFYINSNIKSKIRVELFEYFCSFRTSPPCAATRILAKVHFSAPNCIWMPHSYRPLRLGSLFHIKIHYRQINSSTAAALQSRTNFRTIHGLKGAESPIAFKTYWTEIYRRKDSKSVFSPRKRLGELLYWNLSDDSVWICHRAT